MPQIFNEYLTLEKPINYYGAGLGFDASFIQKMNDYGVSLIECDLDPRLHLNKERKTSIPLGEKTVDLVIFTDVIEHFYDPFYVLQEINRVSKFGSTMILTTDNITRFDSILALILGRSCNVPLVESNLFYNGDWRPHYREYSKNELCQLLSWAGFEVIEHQFYEADFGSYRIINNKLVRKGLSEISLKGRLVNTVRRLTTKVLPYLRDNHILVVKKNKSYEEMIKTSPKIVNNIDAWNKQRKIYSK
jgi:SAM-dependent methyltransferase